MAFEGHGPGIVGAWNDLYGLELGGDIFRFVADDGDHQAGVTAVRSPHPVAVLAADRGRQIRLAPVAEQVNRSGLAVVFAEDAHALLVLRRKRVPGLEHRVHLLVEPEAICIELRQRSSGRGFHLVAMQMHRGGVAHPRRRREHRRRHWQNQQPSNKQDGFENWKRKDAATRHATGVIEGVLPRDTAGGEHRWIDALQVVVLRVHRIHDHVEEEVGETEPAHALDGAPAQQRDDPRNPDQRIHRMHAAELREEELQRLEDDILAMHLAPLRRNSSVGQWL